MATEIDKLKAAADRLLQQAQADSAVAARLEKNAAQEIASAAGCPMPAGVLVTLQRDDGRIGLDIEIDPNFKGELDDKVLDAVAGGAKKETAQSQRASGRGHTTYLGPGAGRATYWGSWPGGKR